MNLEKIQQLYECNEIKLNEQRPLKKFHVSIILKLKAKYGENLLIYDNKNKRKFFSNSLLKFYLNKVIESNVLKNIDNYYFKDDNLSEIISFQVKEIKIIDGKKHVQLDFLRNKNNDYKGEVLNLSSDSDDDEQVIQHKALKEVKTVSSNIDALKNFKKNNK